MYRVSNNTRIRWKLIGVRCTAYSVITTSPVIIMRSHKSIAIARRHVLVSVNITSGVIIEWVSHNLSSFVWLHIVGLYSTHYWSAGGLITLTDRWRIHAPIRFEWYKENQQVLSKNWKAVRARRPPPRQCCSLRGSTIFGFAAVSLMPHWKQW